MAKKQTNTITINGTEYDYESLNDTQKNFLDHVVDLERKIRSSQFNIDQLKIGREAFLNMLTNSLSSDTEEETDVIN
jgi:hypothetical protein